MSRAETVVSPLPVDDLRRLLLAWGDDHWRDLPWRRTRDAWGVLVSEVMLQQTQVERVVARWPEMLAEFPTPASCAEAGQAAVVRAWRGLGYNRRPRALHRAATAIVEEHDGRVPDDLTALLTLPGVGPYTARAVLAFAHERDVAVVDTNVGRILARLRGVTLSASAAQALADQLVPSGAAWRWNQVVLDFGAQVCTKRAPNCTVCPWVGRCTWRGRGDDPALGSAAVSVPQARFAGSDRQYRGRLVDALRDSPLAIADVAPRIGCEDQRARRIVEHLVDEGLARHDGDVLVLA